MKCKDKKINNMSVLEIVDYVEKNMKPGDINNLARIVKGRIHSNSAPYNSTIPSF